MDLANLERLEESIERLLQQNQRIKLEKAAVERRLRQQEAAFTHMKSQIQQYERERKELRERLARIIGEFERLDLS